MMEIRIATDCDRDDIRSIHLSAFPADEKDIVATLAVALLAERTEPTTVSLVAEVKAAVVGHVAFSPVILPTDSNFQGYILAPLAVKPEHQKRGTGSRLVEEGIRRLSEIGVDIVFVYGDPEYYGRFGFAVETAAPYEAPYRLKYPSGWQAFALDKAVRGKECGQIACVTPLCDPLLW